MSRASSKVLLASAGTGKTTRLTNRLLQLYASGASPDRVLASTFTRKAAGEILERAIQRLCAACASDAACADLADQLELPLERAQVVALTVALLRRIDRLRIATLDAWFQERVQRSSFELGLPADWDLCDPELERRLYGRALSRALDRPRTDADWSTLIADLKRGGAEARVHSGLLAALGRAARFARECTEDAWNFPAIPPDVEPAAFERAVEELASFEAPLTQAGTPRKKHQQALLELTHCARARDWSSFACITLVGRVLDGTLKFDKLEIPAAWAACVQVLARRAAHHTAELVRKQNRALRTLAADFLEELDVATRLERRMSFDSMPRLLATHADVEPRFEIAHLLLDEFQDTSRLQWRALERAVDAVVEGPATSFFCVGDVKQSIYAWRDGNPRLLAELGERLSIPTESMELNFRSSAVVLDFVNTIFEGIGDNAVFADDAERAAARRFEDAFQRHRTERALGGCVRLWCGPTFEDGRLLEPREDARIERGVASALELHEAQPGWRIAFLVRNKKLVPRLIERLGRAGLSASGEGGNPLTDSSAVNAALSLLELADHPADDYLLFHVATSPLAEHAGLGFPASPDERRAASQRLSQRWLALGPARFFAELAPAVRAGYGAFDVRRFEQLLALVQRLEPSEPLRPARFAERLAQERVPDPASSQITVMTVHGAKGLEFDAVVLLDLDLPLNKSGERGLAALRRDGDPRALYDVVTHTVKAEEALLLPDLAEAQSAAKSARIQEELCVLYVALTRAVHHIDLLIDHPGDNLRKLSFAGIVLQGIGVDEVPAPASWIPCSLGGGTTVRRSALSVSEAILPLPALAATTIALVPGRGALGLRAPSAKDPRAVHATAELFRGSESARHRGVLWHLWLQLVEWSEAALPEPGSLLEAAHDAGHAWALARDVDDFVAAVAGAEIQRELSRAAVALRLGAAPEELQLLREQAFAFVHPAGDGRDLVKGAFDRAVVSRAQRRGEIVDFKTDRIAVDDEAGLRARAETYRPQLELYRGALARLETLEESRIAMRVCFVSAGRTVTLD